MVVSPHHRTRGAARRTLAAALAALVALVVGLSAACGGGDEATTAAGTAPSPEVASAFPVTIEHEFGATTIAQEPRRVVSIGFTDHDTLLALGVEPVAIRQWYGDHEFVWPWAEGALGEHRPELLPSGDLNFEQIAALEPDLIIGQYIGLERDEYGLLAQIAPTVAQPAGHPPFGAPWQEMARTIGAAVGRAEQAEALVADVEGLFARARAEHPEWAGVDLAYAGVFGGEGATFYVETDGSTRMKVLQDLGFVVPDELAALGRGVFYHELSGEQIGLLEQDVVLWEPAELSLLPEVRRNSLYRNLAVAKEGRDIFMTDPTVAGAMAHATVLSLPVALDFLVPELERAVGAAG